MEEALNEARLAVSLDASGRSQEAITHYRTAAALLGAVGVLPDKQSEYELRARLLALRVFEAERVQPSQEARLRALRDGRDGPVSANHRCAPVEQDDDGDEGDEDAQVEQLLGQVQSELALEGGADGAAAASPTLSSSSEADDDESDERLRAMARAEKERRRAVETRLRRR